MIKSFLKALIVLALIGIICYGAYDALNTIVIFLSASKKNETKSQIQKLFQKLSTEISYLYRLNSISKDKICFEVFNIRTLKTDPITNDKLVEGSIITLKVEIVKDEIYESYKVISRKVDRYEWIEKFGHDQTPGIDGFPEDLKSSRRNFKKGSFVPLETITFFRDLLIQDVKFIPYDGLDRKIQKLTDSESLKDTRNIVIRINYLNKRKDSISLESEVTKVFLNNISRR